MRAFWICMVVACGCSTQWKQPTVQAEPASDIRVCSSIEGVDTAVRSWDYALGNWRRMALTTDSCDVRIDQGSCESNTAIACTDGLGGQSITIQKRLTSGNATHVIAHEMGHVLGAQRVSGTLMDLREDASPFDCPDKTTMAQVAAYHRINIELLRYCWR